MATVRKSRKPKKIQETVEIIAEKAMEEVKQETPDTLSSDHLLALETMSRDIENARLLMAIEEQNLANLELKLHILKSNIEQQKIVVASKNANHEMMKSKYTNLKKSLWPLYGFKETEGLGYNPITGKIVRQQ